MKPILYNLTKTIEKQLRQIYQKGGRIPSALFRDLQIYEEFQRLNTPKMERYTLIAEKFNISESNVREIIRKLSQ